MWSTFSTDLAPINYLSSNDIVDAVSLSSGSRTKFMVSISFVFIILGNFNFHAQRTRGERLWSSWFLWDICLGLNAVRVWNKPALSPKKIELIFHHHSSLINITIASWVVLLSLEVCHDLKVVFCVQFMVLF